MVLQIAKKLSEVDITNNAYYKTNANNFINTLSGKDIEWQNKLNQLDKKDLVVFHDAWGYFSAHFGLNVLATFEPFPGKTPSPQHLINLQQKIKKYNVNALFVEPQLSQEAIKALADDLQISIKILDPLGGIDGRQNYIDLLDYNVNNIVEALQ
jgi:ABC-type Zn uptake system ZnuABC Zn-binding protein ZnuA